MSDNKQSSPDTTQSHVRIRWEDMELSTREYFHVALDKIGPRRSYPVHTHVDFAEIFWVKEGEGTQLLEGGRTVKLTPMHLWFVYPSNRHGFRASRRGMTIYNLVFRSSCLEFLKERYSSNFSSWPWKEGNDPYSIALTQPFHQWLESRAMELGRYPKDIAFIEQFLLSTVCRLHNHLEPEKGPEIPAWVLNLEQQIKNPEFFSAGVSVFKEITGKSYEYIAKTTKRYFHMTPSELLNKARIEYAAELLAMDNDSIGEIAGKCGFKESSYFYRQFQKHYNCSAYEYRERQRFFKDLNNRARETSDTPAPNAQSRNGKRPKTAGASKELEQATC